MTRRGSPAAVIVVCASLLCCRPAIGAECLAGADAASCEPQRGDDVSLLALHGDKALDLGNKVTLLSQKDFADGTYRILRPGSYRLTEDIEFGPRPDHDFWPDPEDEHWPSSQFYLGFFAAITVECDNVEIDLAGHGIRQSKEFYLLQRFFNVIELADRVFVDNEGVSSLNFQTGDAQLFQKGRVRATHGAQNVVIRDGTLGLSSHSGIHGNGAGKVLLKRLVVRDFEVSGIHLNGCTDCSVSECQVGPSSTRVPVRASFASARHLLQYTETFIPRGFQQEDPQLLDLLKEGIAFADRPATTLRAVFDGLRRAVALFREQHMGRLEEADLDAPDRELLARAAQLFASRSGLPDGSVVYGILFSDLGSPHEDENYYGAGDEASRISIAHSAVVGLRIKPQEVASVLLLDGQLAQGPTRDNFRILEVVDNRLRELEGARYRGDALHDAYLALWQLSNRYYEARIFQSGCGNFASNGTLSYSYAKGVCLEAGVSKNPSLTGRDITLLQKKYFGGLRLSSQLYDWATSTPGRGLAGLFASAPRGEDRFSSKHTLLCDQDAMHHPMQGVVGIKLRRVRKASLRHVQVANLTNDADAAAPSCQRTYKLASNGEDVIPEFSATDRGGAANIRGLDLRLSEEVELDGVDVAGLDSDEGAVVGVDVRGDASDRSDYEDRCGTSLDGVSVRRLRAGRGAAFVSATDTQLKVAAAGRGFSSDQPVDSGNEFRQPKLLIGMDVGLNGFVVFGSAHDALGLLLNYTSYGTIEKVRAFRRAAFDYFRNVFGLRFPHGAEELDVTEPVPVIDANGQATDTQLTLSTLYDLYKPSHACVRGRGCWVPRESTMLDCFWNIVTGPSGLFVKGVFAGEQGQQLDSQDFMLFGIYALYGLRIPELNPRGDDLEILFGSECPIRLRGDLFPGALFGYLNCFLESDLFGTGAARSDTTFINGVTTLTNTLVFEDEWPARVAPSGRRTLPPPLGVYARVETLEAAYIVVADGVLSVSKNQGGSEVFPLLLGNHFLHEAGIKFLRRWTPAKSDASIRRLRARFLTYLRDDFGVERVQPEALEREPLENQLDLGGGNTVAPYELNHMSNQRAITKFRVAKEAIPLGRDARLHEGGFRLFAGPSGLNVTVNGTLPVHMPYGSMLQMGYLVLESDPSSAEPLQIEFRTRVPMVPNPFSTMAVVHDLTHPALGEGQAQWMVALPAQTPTGMRVVLQGTLRFPKQQP